MSKIGIDIDCPFANDNWGTHILEDLRGECQRDIPALVKVVNYPSPKGNGLLLNGSPD